MATNEPRYEYLVGGTLGCLVFTLLNIASGTHLDVGVVIASVIITDVLCLSLELYRFK